MIKSPSKIKPKMLKLTNRLPYIRIVDLSQLNALADRGFTSHKGDRQNERISLSPALRLI